ncbi:hypothetical protein IAD21_00518 [Abditibacteriota bacterium]|nr:hypothetical protein IAD21_00518 [Abditibacteriota bacterium]
MRRAFSLVELLVVIAIITILAAILLPVFWTVRGKARQTACTSNLRQIGTAIQMYTQDYDGYYPYAIDPSDRVSPSIWSRTPAFQSQIPRMPYLQDCIRTYTSSLELFHCPGDVGFDVADFTGISMNALPTSFEKYGSSYYYRTEVAAYQINESAVPTPDRVNLVFDGAGAWHGTLVPLQRRYNLLYADCHVKNISNEQMSEAWATPITHR